MAAKAAPAPVAELTGPLAALKDKFGDAVRPGDYEGAVISNDRLVEAALYMRDDLGYDYLSSVTAVDKFEGTCEAIFGSPARSRT